MRYVSKFCILTYEEKIIGRKYYYYECIETQIAIAIELHEDDFQKKLRTFYSETNKKIRIDLDLEKAKTNYGNISFYQKEKPKCQEQSEVFRPFYFDWKLKWSEFLSRIIAMEHKNVLVLKIDFIDAYGNLDYNEIPTDNNSMKFIKKMLSKYDLTDENNKNGIPYGGPLESHMAANFLIFKKLEKIARIINSEKIFKVVDLVTYADDSLLVIEVKKGESIENGVGELKNILEKNHKIFKFHELDEKDKSKTYIFKVLNGKTYEEIRDSYTSISTIDSMFLASDLSEVSFDILEYDNNQKAQDIIHNRTTKKIIKKNIYKKIDNMIDIKEFENNPSEYIDIVKNDKYLVPSIIKLLIKFENHFDRGKILKTVIGILENPKNPNQITMNEFNIRTSNSMQTSLIVSFLYKVAIKANEWKAKDVMDFVFQTIKKIKNTPDYIEFINDVNEVPTDVEKHKKSVIIKSTLSLMYNLLKKWEESKVKEDKGKFYKNDLKIIKFIKEKKDRMESRKVLIEHIKKINSFSGCKYKRIDLNHFNEIFNAEEFECKFSHEDYWSYTKSALSFIFSKIFEKSQPLLYVRYKRFLKASENRIQFISHMKYLSSNLDKLIDLNEMVISDEDNSYFKLISLTIDSTYNKEVIHEIDKLILIRQLTKLLWSNGSLSTQSFTSHSHEHGDTLLLKLNEIKNISFIRNNINRKKFKIMPLIASLYLHDLGMLLNVEGDRWFNDKLKNIYVDVAKTVRNKHGVKSSEILLRKIAKLLDINSEWISPIALSSIAHQEGVEDLSFEDEAIKNNALILSVLDLFDVTFERSSILSRMLTGDYVSDISKLHWQKHYLVRTLKIRYEESFILEFGINKSILSQYSEVQQQKIVNFVISDIKKWLPSLFEKIFDSKLFDNGKNIMEKLSPDFIDFRFNLFEYPENHKSGYYEEKNKGIDINLI